MTTEAATIRIKQAVSIVKVVSQYVRLKPSGKDRLSGLCPFHREKSPSFTVRPSTNLWNCFGCHKGGDVFTFVSLIENCSFLQARKELAEWYGIDLEDRPQTRQDREREQAQHVYAQQVGRESANWWDYVKCRYSRRYELMVRCAQLVADADDEVACQHYSRRAWRWGTILLRMAERDQQTTLRAYIRIRNRPDVRYVVAQDINKLWAHILQMAPQLTEEQVYGAAVLAFGGKL